MTSSSLPSSISSTSSATSDIPPYHHKVNNGTIIGASVGSAIAGLAAASLLALCLRRRNRRRRDHKRRGDEMAPPIVTSPHPLNSDGPGSPLRFSWVGDLLPFLEMENRKSWHLRSLHRNWIVRHSWRSWMEAMFNLQARSTLSLMAVVNSVPLHLPFKLHHRNMASRISRARRS